LSRGCDGENVFIGHSVAFGETFRAVVHRVPICGIEFSASAAPVLIRAGRTVLTIVVKWTAGWRHRFRRLYAPIIAGNDVFVRERTEKFRVGSANERAAVYDPNDKTSTAGRTLPETPT